MSSFIFGALSRARSLVRVPNLMPSGASLLQKISSPNLVIARNMANKKHKKIIKLAKGFRGRANRCYSVAYHRVIKAKQYAYRDRKVKKRDFRTLWIQRVNAASRIYGLPYSILVNSMQKTNISLNRQVLANLAVTEPLSFRSVVEVAKQAGASKKAAASL